MLGRRSPKQNCLVSPKVFQMTILGGEELPFKNLNLLTTSHHLQFQKINVSKIFKRHLTLVY